MRSDYRPRFKIQLLAVIFLLTMTLPVFAQNVVAPKRFNGPAVGTLQTMTAEYKDTLVDLALEKHVGYTQLLAANPNVDPWVPGAGTKLVLPNWHILPDAPREGLVINTGELRLYYYPPDGSAPKTFPIGIGREGLSSPKGSSTVVRKVQGPTWRPTPRMRLEKPELKAEYKTGPDNPLGAYALYMGWPGYLIHGTNKQKAVGRRASSGCIRMYDSHIDWMYHNVPVGTKITSVNEPIKMAWINGALFLEAEPSDLQVDEIEYQNRQMTVDIPDGVIARIREKAGDKVQTVDWALVRNVLIERTGIPTQISTGDTAIVPMKEEIAAVKPEQTEPPKKTVAPSTKRH